MNEQKNVCIFSLLHRNLDGFFVVVGAGLVLYRTLNEMYESSSFVHGGWRAQLESRFGRDRTGTGKSRASDLL